MSAQAMPRKMVDSFTDGPLLHLLEQHRDFKATMEGRRRGLRIAAWSCFGVWALFAVIGLAARWFNPSEILASDKYSIGFADVLFVGLALVLFAIVLICNHVLIKRPQTRYAKALAEAHPGLDLDDEGSFQSYVWEREGHPDSFLPRLYNWLVWKSRETALSPAEQVVKDVWNLNDINAEVFEFGVHANLAGDAERIAGGIASFGVIGADRAADIWAQALPLLEKVGGAVRSMHQMEGEIYDQLGELNEQLYELEPETHALLYDYVMKHKTEFVSEQAADTNSEEQP